MAYARLWADTRAPGRKDDSDRWLTVEVQEAPSASGPWTSRGTQAWPDLTPSTPDAADIEITNATLEHGWYRFNWHSQAGIDSGWAGPVFWSVFGNVVEQVASLVRARTRNRAGNELGIFTDETRPTALEVELLVQAETALVELTVGSLDSLDCPRADGIRSGASQVIAKRVAAIIEASYRPDELAQGRTVADFYSGDRESDVEALKDASESCRAYTPGDDDTGGGRNMEPVGFFPCHPRVVI